VTRKVFVRNLIMIVAAGVVLLTACPAAAPPPPSGTTSHSVGTPAPGSDSTPSVPPGTEVIGTCAILPDADCREADLKAAPLARADLRRADLREADLYGADLRHADLRDADLTDANLKNTDLTDADLRGADLTGANLVDANLTKTNFEDATVELSQMKKSLTCETIRPDGTTDDTDCNESPLSPVAPGEPAITKYKVPKDATGCVGTVKKVEIRVSYDTQNAETVEFEVDGEPLGGNQVFEVPSGDADLEYRCADPEHSYTIIATDTSGDQVEKTKTAKSA